MPVQQECSLEIADQRGVPASLQYLLYLPPNYSATAPTAAWPLVLFLHGAGERGDHVWDIARHGIPKVIEAGMSFPFIAVSPQCRPERRWEIPALCSLLDHMIGELAVDRDRIYVTGLSMGGFGTWALAMAQPRRFAAIAPICGGGDSARVCDIAHLPIWAFHGAADQIVPLARSADLVRALYECGGEPRFTVYPEAGHDSWTVTYDNPRLYEWLLSHRRRP